MVDEGLDLVRDSTWADVALLHSIDGDQVTEVAPRPTRVAPSSVTSVGLDWFPWGLAQSARAASSW